VTRPAGVVTTAGSVTRRPSDSLVASVVVYDAYALDTEFHPGEDLLPQAALIQLAWRGGSPSSIAAIDVSARRWQGA